ncbi:MAG: nucleotidyltransferase domain-containing protein, partial [Firmicutes bacterium]|nr:nucleotidyltransferase domain-containing protein [Bacillota bacterium]
MFWPDSASVDGSLRRYVSSLVRREEVVGVYLCGSRAKGTHTAASDVDLLILIKGGSAPALLKPRDRIPAYLPDSFPTSLDLFVYTEAEARTSSFARRLLEEG